MKWILDKTVSGLREVNEVVQPWASYQWALAVEEWKEQKAFYQFVSEFESEEGAQGKTAASSGARNFKSTIREITTLSLLCWLEKREAQAEAQNAKDADEA